MGKELIPKVDLIAASLDHLLAVSFPKSTSNSYPIAVSIAQGAYSYQTSTLTETDPFVLIETDPLYARLVVR